MEEKKIYAGFWLRFIAFIIDNIVLFGIAFLTGFLIAKLAPESLQKKITPSVLNTIAIITAWIYFSLMESSKKQGTIGKILIGIKVTDINQKPIGFVQASARFFGKIISAIILGIGFIMIAFTKKKQGLHDILAECLVVKS